MKQAFMFLKIAFEAYNEPLQSTILVYRIPVTFFLAIEKTLPVFIFFLCGSHKQELGESKNNRGTSLLWALGDHEKNFHSVQLKM